MLFKTNIDSRGLKKKPALRYFPTFENTKRSRLIGYLGPNERKPAGRGGSKSRSRMGSYLSLHLRGQSRFSAGSLAAGYGGQMVLDVNRTR